MSNELVPVVDGIVSGESRRASRSIARSRSAAQVRMARVADEADIAIEKLEQISFATINAMGAIARVNGAQKLFEQQAPELAGRLNRLADFHELAAVQSIEDMRRDIRRR